MMLPDHDAGQAELREKLLGQLAYLIDEVEALEPLLERIPEQALEGRLLEGDLSVKERYGLLATLDEQVYLPRLRRIVSGEEPAWGEIDETRLLRQENWHQYSFPAILHRVAEGRKALVDYLESLSPGDWNGEAGRPGARMTLYEAAYRIIERDVEHLRAAGYRLHETRLSTRVQGLPQ